MNTQSNKRPMNKQRLNDFLPLRMEVENRLEKLERLKNEARIPAVRHGDESKHNPGSGDRMERAVLRYMEYEQEISPKVEAAKLEMQEINEAINRIPDPLEREVLRLRYMDGENCRRLKWREISIKVFGDDEERHLMAIYRIHGKALEDIQAYDL